MNQETDKPPAELNSIVVEEKAEAPRKLSSCLRNKKEKKGRKKMRLDLQKKAGSSIPGVRSKHDAKKDDKSDEIASKEVAEEGRSPLLQNGENCPEFFGVRSYLHNFYESVSVRNPQLYEDIYEDEMIYINETRKQRKAAVYCWRFNLGMGAFILGIGLVFILIGYFTPLHKGITAHEEDFVIIDRDAAKFNYYLKLSRIIGLIAFCVGGCVFCFTMMINVFFNINQTDDDEEQPIESFCGTLIDEDIARTPTDKKIPATEELTSIQPKREVDDVVMTNSGLCKPPALKASPDN